MYIYIYIYIYIYTYMYVYLLPTEREEKNVFGVPVAILPSCHNMKPSHYNYINRNIVG